MKLSDIKVGYKYKYWMRGSTLVEQIVEIGDGMVKVVIIKPLNGGVGKVGEIVVDSISSYLAFFDAVSYTRLKDFKEYADWDKG